MIIYRITNDINKKIYIGQTKGKLCDRITAYRNNINSYKNKKRSGKYPIIMAMVKYGFQNFRFEILEDDIKTQSQLDLKEIFYIKQYDSQNKKIGYNIQPGGKSGGSGRYKKLSKEQVKDIIDSYLTLPVDQIHTLKDIYNSLMVRFDCSKIYNLENVEGKPRKIAKKGSD